MLGLLLLGEQQANNKLIETIYYKRRKWWKQLSKQQITNNKIDLKSLRNLFTGQVNEESCFADQTRDSHRENNNIKIST